MEWRLVGWREGSISLGWGRLSSSISRSFGFRASGGNLILG